MACQSSVHQFSPTTSSCAARARPDQWLPADWRRIRPTSSEGHTNYERFQQKGLRSSRDGGRRSHHPDGVHIDTRQRRPTARPDAPTRPDQTDRRRRPERRLRRSRPARRPTRHPAARLALRHPQLRRCHRHSSPHKASGSSCRILRGFGTTRFRSEQTVRNGQQAALAHDVIALMDALHIPSAILGGYDWGGAYRQCRRRAVAAAVHRTRRRQRLHHRQPRDQPRTPATAGRIRLVVPVLLRHPTRRARLPPQHQGLQQAHLDATPPRCGTSTTPPTT